MCVKYSLVFKLMLLVLTLKYYMYILCIVIFVHAIYVSTFKETAKSNLLLSSVYVHVYMVMCLRRFIYRLVETLSNIPDEKCII